MSMSDEVSNDLLVNIFERLPPKNVIRLRSLSKYWHSRVASPEFVRNYNLRRAHSKNPDQKVLIRHLYYCGNNEFKDIYTLHDGEQLPLDPGSEYPSLPGVEFPCCNKEIIGSCNGILCLRSNSNNIRLWNVSIRRVVLLPRYPSSKSSSHNAIFGFGFDPISYDYKVVAITYSVFDKLHDNNVFIYSLKTNAWSATTTPSSCRFYDVRSKACFFNGVLHWVVDGCGETEQSTQDHHHQRSRFILTFNLSTCVFGQFMFAVAWRIRQLTTINGCLTVVCLGVGNSYSIKTMKEYGNPESWCKSYKLDIKEAFELIRVFQVPGDLKLLVAYYETKTETKVSKFGNVEMEAYAESLELLDVNERAITACGETIFSWTREDNKTDLEKLMIRLRIALSLLAFLSSLVLLFV